MKRLFLLIFVLFICAGNAAGISPCNALALDEDEKRLWLRAEEEEKNLDRSGYIYRNSEIDGYLDTVVRTLVPHEVLETIPIRVSIIKNPYFSAFTFPNGRIYVHSGMLVAMENEAQLATLLGHEISHSTGRHMLKEMRDAKDKIAFTATLGALTGNVILPIGQLGALAAISGYSRELETNADEEGLRLMIQAGYDPAEAPKLFVTLQKEALKEKRKEPFFFGSHPKLQERIDNFDTLLKTAPTGKQGGIANTDRFLRAISPLLLDNAVLDLKAGRIENARRCIERYLDLKKDDARGYFLLGETYRQSEQKEEPVKAQEYYLKAAMLDPSYPDPHRCLGILAFKRNDFETARKSFERYLVLFPKAPDRGYIEEMLKSAR
jgi:beta-barrel assembly-enhancing protease